MRKLLLILLFTPFFSFSQEQHDQHDHHGIDEYEVRYIKEQLTTDLALQQTLRNQNAWQNFLTQHPHWFVNFNEYNLKPHRAYGEPIELLIGNTIEDKALQFIQNELSSFNIPISDLYLLDVRENEKYKYLDFKQKYNGLKVHDSRLYIKTTQGDELVTFGLDVFSDINLNTLPTISESNAISSAISGITNSISNTEVKQARKILPIPKNNKYNYHLVYEVEFETKNNIGPAKYLCFVDANNGELLMRKNTILFETPPPVSVHVESNVYAVQPYVPMTVENLVNLRVVVNGTSYYTDQNGDITLPANTGSNVYYGLEGLWSKVETGGSTPSINTTLGATNNISFDNYATSQERSAYYHMNVVHDYMKTIFPTFIGLDFAMTTNVDVAGSCNAFYGGGNINFYAEGNDCNSMAKIGDVVYHEYGHGINDYRYGNSGMWNSALGEGYADVWALAITQDPILGQGISLSDSNDFVRRYDIDRKVYPQDLIGEVHADGEIIAGCWWDTYLGFNNIGQMMDLFKYTYDGAPDGAGGTEGIIYTDVLLEALMADDNDGNVYNGTPNDQIIIDAFALHGITLLSNAYIFHSQVLTSFANQDIQIDASIALTYAWALSSAKVFYKLNNATSWNSVPLTSTGGTTYIGHIPAQPAGTLIAYYILLEDTYGKQSGITPMAANLSQHANVPYFILNGFDFIGIEDFDNNVGFWQLGKPSDNATTGQWEIDEPIGSFSDPTDSSTIVQTDKDHTPGSSNKECAFTGNAGILNGIGTNDVDGGHTTLFSPFYDLTNYSNPVFTYYRWYINNPPSGANPGADWWQVLVTDDGINWQYVENNMTSDKSWRRFAFRVADYVNLTNQVRVKFIASDSTHLGQYLDGGSIVEAAVDDFSLYEEVAIYGCTDSLATNYNANATVDDGSCVCNINITPDSTARGINTQVFISASDSSAFKVGSEPAVLSLIQNTTGEILDVPNNYSNWTWNANENSYGFYSDVDVDSTHLDATISGHATLTQFSSYYTNYYLNLNVTNQVTEATVINFETVAYYMDNSVGWYIYDESGNLLTTLSSLGSYSCTPSSISYTASASQMQQWSANGVITFRCYNYGFTSTNYGTATCNGEYLTISFQYDGFLEQLTNPGVYSLNKKANGNNGTLCDIVNQGSSITLTAPQGATISSIDYASYGNPQGSCGNFTNGICNGSNSMSVVQSYCLGQTSCTVPATNGVFGNPCTGMNKQLAIQASYSFGSNTPEDTLMCPDAFTIYEGIPVLQQISPDTANISSNLSVTISGFSMNFGQMPTTGLSNFRITNSTGTYNGISTSTVGDSLFGTLNIPLTSQVGLYDLEVYDQTTNQWIVLTDAFEILPIYLNPVRITPNQTIPGDSLGVFISGTQSEFQHFNQTGGAPLRLLQADGSTIPIVNFAFSNWLYNNSVGSYGFNTFIDVPQNATLGIYALQVDYNALNNWSTLESNAFGVFDIGCTDSSAYNYNPLAILDDGSCIYPTVCNTPISGLFMTDVIHDRATFNFDNMNTSNCIVDQLRIKYRAVGTSSWSQKNMGSPTGFNNGVCNSTQRTDKRATGLSPSTTYQWQMKVWYCSTGATAWVNGPNFTTEDLCPNVINFTATPVNTVKVNFTWDTTTAYSFVRIKLRVDTTNASWLSAGGFGVNYPALSKQKGGLSPGETYRGQARTWCSPSGGAYRSLAWTPLIFWTQPASIKIEGENTAITDLEVYPNPSRDVFNITFTSNEKQDLEIRIINVIGEKVFIESKQQFVGEYTKQINLGEYPKAIYFLEIETDDGVINKKLILQ